MVRTAAFGILVASLASFYSCSVEDTKPPLIIATPDAGHYRETQTVSLQPSEEATIYFTLDGKTPTEGSYQYSSSLKITSDTILKYYAIDSAENTSDVYIKRYYIDTVPPVSKYSVSSGNCDTGLVVSLSTNEESTIFYTTDGTEPTTFSPIYNDMLTIYGDNPLKFFSVDTVGNAEKIRTYNCINNDLFTPAEQKDSFSFIVIPDSHVVASSPPAVFQSQIDWILENAEQENILFVLHVGDLVDIHDGIARDKQHKMFNYAANAFNAIYPTIPYIISIGNHDYDYYNYLDKKSGLFNTYFPIEKYSALQSFGGSFDERKIDNAYHLFKGALSDWMVLSLEFCPGSDIVSWANDIVAANPDHKVILLTHAFLDEYGTIGDENGSKESYTLDIIWDELASISKNILMTFSGHYGHTNFTSQRITENTSGDPVYQFMLNFQFSQYANNGYFWIVTVGQKDGTISFTAYSPYLDSYIEDSSLNYTLSGVDFLR